MIGTIISKTQEFTKNGDEYVKVVIAKGDGSGETTKSIFNQLEAKWELLQENATLEFVMEKKGQYWNVVDIKPITTSAPVKPPLAEGVDVQAETKAMTKDMSIARMNGLTNSCNLVGAGMMDMGSVGLLAYQFERYSLGIINADQLDSNIKALLKVK